MAPASRCLKCGVGIKPYDNIPVLSWLILGGKCRNCHTSISAMYPSIEFLTAVLFVACYLCFGLSIPTFKWIFFGCIILVLIVTDYRERILPDAVNWFGVGLGRPKTASRAFCSVLSDRRASLHGSPAFWTLFLVQSFAQVYSGQPHSCTS